MPTLLEPGNLVEQKWMSSNEKKRIKLLNPIEYIIDFLEDRFTINKNLPAKIKAKGIGGHVVVLKSGTGSGKSTTLPPYIYNKFFESVKKNIAVTQPRVLTAVDIPYQILQYNKNLRLGENIGYQTGTIIKKPVKGITFMTTGILLQQFKIMTDEQIIKKYSFVIIDEVHERQLDVDSVLFYIKQFLLRNWNQPVCPMFILMSATFDQNIFMDYFECPKEHFIQVSGSTYEIEKHFAPTDITDYINYVVDLAENIHVVNIDDVKKGEKFRDILIFVQGGAQMTEIVDKLHYLNSTVFGKTFKEIELHNSTQQKKYVGGKETYYIAPIALNSENFGKGGKDYKDLFSDINTVDVPIYDFEESKYGLVRKNIVSHVIPCRRVIVATNVAETGVTIDTLKYCIDTGWVKSAEFNPNFGCNLLVDKNVTRAASEQRRGRVGRKAPGVWYACYTEETLNKFPPMQFPDIVSSDVSQNLLSVIIGETETSLEQVDSDSKNYNKFQKNQIDQKYYVLESHNPFDASTLDFIQYPSSDSIGYGVEKLYTLGFIDHEYKPTLFGYYGVKFRKLKLENIRMILAGYHHGANILDLLTIACCIELSHKIGIKKNKYIPRNPLEVSAEESFYNYKLLFCDEFVEYLFIWYDFMDAIENVGDMLEKNVKTYKKDKMPLQYLPKWAEENGFKIEGLMEIIELRDEILCEMLTMGLNPYYNGLLLSRGEYDLVKIMRKNLAEGIEEIKKIKYCIYEGYRLNLCIWNDLSKTYVWQQNHANVVLDSKLIKPLIPSEKNEIIQVKPQKIIVSNIMLRESQTSNLYEFVGSDVSILDGFVDVDVEFTNR